MLNELKLWPKKIKDGLDLAHNFHFEYSSRIPKNIKKIVFFGMGGSGIAGRIVKTFLDRETSIPTFIVDSPEVPNFVDSETFAVVVSYSGNTWEVVSALDSLVKKFVPTIVLAHGGRAIEVAENKNLPFVLMPGALQPRFSLGASLGFLFGLLDLMGILGGKKILDSFLKVANIALPKLEDESNFSDFLDLARDKDFFHIWGVSGDSSSFAYRAQTQFNENSKVCAVSSVFPELAHNLLNGFETDKGNGLVLFFSSDFLSAKMNIAIESIFEVLTKKGVKLYKPTLFGDTWPGQLFYMILWSDFASYYLGKARDVDVVSVKMIESLKKTFSSKIGK